MTYVYGEYVSYTLSSPSSIGSYGIGTYGDTMAIFEWYLLGSDNNSTWDIIDYQNTLNTNAYNTTTYTLSSPSPVYPYIRILLRALTNYNTSGYFFYRGGFWLKNQQGSFLMSSTRTTSSNIDFTYELLNTTNTGMIGPNINMGVNYPARYWTLYGGSGFSYTDTSAATLLNPLTGPPRAPISLSAVSGNNSITVSFTPGSDRGSSITNYKYSINNGSSYTEFSPAITSSPIVISGLTNGTLYSIKILAVNEYGDGTPSNTVTATPHTVPDAPTNIVASYNGSGSVSISFTPGSNGGDTISNYQYSIDAGATFTPLNPVDGITPVTIDGLTNGQTYIIELKAVNSVGAGIASSSVEYTASGLPDVPTSLTWVDSYNGNITVSFTPGSNQGSTITNYLYSLDNGNTYTAFSPPQTGSSVYITGLTNRTQYNIELKAVNANGQSTTSAPLALYYMCFLEGTKILCYDSVANQEVERSIESLRSGDLVKTTMDGYKAIDTIGTSKIYNPANSMRSKNRLYKYSKENHPELKEDLVITGCHAVLVSDLSEEERSDLIDIQGKVYVTADYYRLIACVDKRAQPYEKEGLFNIWHLALENDNYYFNYGIYANGLKVETASKRMMKEMSGMDLVQ